MYIASDFPLTVQQVLPVIDVFARTSTHLEHVSRFLQTKLPPGFPIAFSVPIVPSVSAKVCVRMLHTCCSLRERCLALHRSNVNAPRLCLFFIGVFVRGCLSAGLLFPGIV